MWAHIQNGVVVEVTDRDPTGRFHSSLVWEPINSDGVKRDWRYQDGEFLPPLDQDITVIAGKKRRGIEAARKSAEDDGVIIKGIRYSGSRDNRTEILQALQSTDDSGIEAFPHWKDSDNVFHFNHPVADVRAASLEIATRRNELIIQEGELNAQIDNALEAEDREALESISWLDT